MKGEMYPRTSMERDERLIRTIKANGSTSCESCQWAPPACLDVPGSAPAVSMLHAHHVVPVACGGPDTPRNIAVLCPTCHAIAHRLSVVRRAANKRRVRGGPETREALLTWLEWARTEPERLRTHLIAVHDRVASDVALIAASAARARTRRQNRDKRQAQALACDDVTARDTGNEND